MFDSRTGKFIPLSDAQLARLNPDQRSAYDDLRREVALLDAANTEAESAIKANHAAVAALHAAEAAAAKQPKHTFLDELRASQRQWREDHR
jgi:hypothetical protein